MRRIETLKRIGLVIMLLAVAAAAPGAEYLMYVGTYTGSGSEGIYALRFDPTTGETESLGLAVATENPSFLAVDLDGQFVYAVNELETFRDEPAGAVSVFAIDRRSGKLRPMQQVSSLGGSPAHLSLDASGRYLLVANYGGGSVAVFPIGTDGLLGTHSAFVQNSGSSVDPERQNGPHAHFIHTSPDNRLAVVADLGLDKLLLHRFDPATGSLTPGSPAFVRTEPGSGPRHVAFASSGTFVYVVNELVSTVTVLAHEKNAATWRNLQTISTLPEEYAGTNYTAEIAVDPTGQNLYVSNRGHDTIAVFGIDPDDGILTQLEWASSGGSMPRHFAIDPTGQWLLTAYQASHTIRVLRIEPHGGQLTPIEQSIEVVAPVCLVFVPQLKD